eukprot:COSAG02_NODE_335_length_24359_cov_282.817354_12_plen_258_part_00
MQELEQTFPDYTPLLPPRGSPARKTTDAQMAMERDLFGSWLRWLRAEESPRARKGFEQAMDKTDTLLASNGGPYFGGAAVSLADCVFASSLERISASILYYKGLQVKGAGRWTHVDSWFAAMESRPAYRYVCRAIRCDIVRGHFCVYVLRLSTVPGLRKAIITPMYTTCHHKSVGAFPRAHRSKWPQLHQLTARMVRELENFDTDSEQLNLELCCGWRRCCLATPADAEHTRAWCDDCVLDSPIAKSTWILLIAEVI